MKEKARPNALRRACDRGEPGCARPRRPIPAGRRRAPNPGPESPALSVPPRPFQFGRGARDRRANRAPRLRPSGTAAGEHSDHSHNDHDQPEGTERFEHVTSPRRVPMADVALPGRVRDRAGAARNPTRVRGQRASSTRCVSLRRAPAMMPCIPMLPSWQAYSKSVPSVRRNGIIAVQGRV